MGKYTPLKNLCIANHKIVKSVFSVFNTDEYADNYTCRAFSVKGCPFFVSGNEVRILKEDSKKNEMIKYKVKYPCKLHVQEDTLIYLTDAEREYIKTPPNLFDRLIFTALTSLYYEGGKEISISALYRIITGKANHECRPSKKSAAEILASVKKLACLRISIDTTDAFTHYTNRDGTPKYNDGKPIVINYEPIISCRIFDGSFQSKELTQIIQLTAESPLFKIARLMHQLLTAPYEVLDIGNMRDSVVFYGVKLYTLIRVLENKHLQEAISFEDIYSKCKIEGEGNSVTSKVRNVILAILLNLQNGGILSSFEVIREGSTYTKINLKYFAPSKRRKGS